MLQHLFCSSAVIVRIPTKMEIIQVKSTFWEKEQQLPKKINIALYGSQGVGKSSLKNSCKTAVMGNHYHEIVRTGQYDDGSTISQRYQCNDITDKISVCDVTGFPDENSSAYVEIMHAVNYGRIKNETSLRNVFQMAERNPSNAGDIMDAFPRNAYSEDRKIRCAVYVASAENIRAGNLHENHLDVIKEACTPGAAGVHLRVIPLILVITKHDKVSENDSDYQKNKSRVISRLGLTGNEDLKVFEITNYTADTAPERIAHTYPTLDIPIFKFLTSVCMCFPVEGDDETLEDRSMQRKMAEAANTVSSVLQQASPRWISFVPVFVLIVAIILYKILFS